MMVPVSYNVPPPQLPQSYSAALPPLTISSPPPAIPPGFTSAPPPVLAVVPPPTSHSVPFVSAPRTPFVVPPLALMIPTFSQYLNQQKQLESLRKLQNQTREEGPSPPPSSLEEEESLYARPRRRLLTAPSLETLRKIVLPLTITELPRYEQEEVTADLHRKNSLMSSSENFSSSASTSSCNSDAVSSQDSGRATGGLASSLSPMDDAGDSLPQYEFEIPNSLVGLIIGIKGKTIKELSTRTGVRMMIRPHHSPPKVETYQICQVRGKRDQVNKCLQMLRRRFPPERFPDLNLQPIVPPIVPHTLMDAFNAQPSWLTLPDLVSTEVAVSSAIDPGHIFLQQPTHPSYSSLSHLDLYMLSLYSQGTQLPDLPTPCQSGLLCAAPVINAWFRAVTVTYYEDTDDVLVRFVDYGGYTKMPRSSLKQIRSDLMSLPFQAIECYLAHVRPIDGTLHWGEEALKFFQNLAVGKVINAYVVGYHADDRVPMVELTVQVDDKVLRVDQELMKAGFAKASDPSKMQRVAQAGAITGTKRPSYISQSSQVSVN